MFWVAQTEQKRGGGVWGRSNGKKCWRWRWVEMYKKERAENGGGSKRNEKEYGGGTGRDVQGREC